MQKDDFGNRMKALESINDQKLMPNLPIILRADGRSFSKFTKGLNKPYDKNFMQLMDETTKFLVKETSALLGFVQSDEITILLYNYGNPKRDTFFSGRVNKLNSVVASLAAAYFNSRVAEFLPSKVGKLAAFDCRSFCTPSEVEAVNVLIWRSEDAYKNSQSMLAQAYFSPKELHKKTGAQMQEMLYSVHGINFNDEPARFKRGGFFRKVLEEKMLPSRSPYKNGELELSVRSSIQAWDLPQLTKIENRVDVIFHGAEPVLKKEIQ